MLSKTLGRNSREIFCTVSIIMSASRDVDATFASRAWRKGSSVILEKRRSHQDISIFNPESICPKTSCTSRAIPVRSSSRNC